MSGLIASALELNLEDEYLDSLIETYKVMMHRLQELAKKIEIQEIILRIRGSN